MPIAQRGEGKGGGGWLDRGWQFPRLGCTKLFDPYNLFSLCCAGGLLCSILFYGFLVQDFLLQDFLV